MAEIKAVIFDWGGVLIEDPLPGLMQYCADALGVFKEEYIQAHNKFADDFSKGIISEEIFWGKVCGELGRPAQRMAGKPLPQTPTLWGDAFRAVYRPRADMFALVSLLHKAGYKTALLSNTEVPAMQFFHLYHGLPARDTTARMAVVQLFDVLVFSCAEGVMKPEKKIYEIAIERLGSRPEQTIFIDDNPAFIKGAKQAGLNTIFFQNIEQLKKKLTQFGLLLSQRHKHGQDARATCHLVILKKPYLDAILTGRKKIEARFIKTKRYEFGRVLAGDKLFLKLSSGPVCATAIVAAVKNFENLTPKQITEIKQQYNHYILGSDEYWRSKSNCRYGFLVWLKNVQTIEPVRICKKDWRAWVVLTEKENFGLLKIDEK